MAMSKLRLRHSPLGKYGVINLEYTVEPPRYYFDRTISGSLDEINYKMTSSYEVIEARFEKQGLESLVDKLNDLENEERLRQQYPALQKAWEQYQLMLEIMK